MQPATPLSAMLATLAAAMTIVLAPACASTQAPAQAAVPVIVLDHASVLLSDSAELPGPEAPWRTITLPERAPKPRQAELVGYWYKSDFIAPVGTTPLWVYFSRLPSGGTIFVNGERIAEIASATSERHVRWYRPHLQMIPPSALHAGSNTIAVRLAIREPRTSVGTIQIGPEPPLRAAYDRLDFWEFTAAEISSAVCLLAGMLILLFWWRRPQERLYGLFGVCVLFWGMRTLLLLTPIVPMPLSLLWRGAYYFTTGGFIVLITVFMLAFSGRVPRRLVQVLTAYWLGGCILFALFGMAVRPLLNSWWLLGFLPPTVYSVICLCRFALRQRTRASLAMGLSVALALGLSLHDFAVQEAWISAHEIYLMHLAIPSFLLVMAGVLSERFLDSLKKIETINDELAVRVAQREREITESYGRVRLLERVNAATEERQRIMQDMHDGVGSQLLTTLVMAERGIATRDDMLLQLRECVDDMRLAIEALAGDAPDLLPVLGTFRQRMVSRFRAAGLDLQWRNLNLPDSLDVSPHASLNILRILQEALANVLKHANATRVVVELDFTQTALRISVADDGSGFAGVPRTGGQGLHNMRARATRIAAALEIEQSGRGTTVRCDVPLAAVLLPASNRPGPVTIGVPTQSLPQ